MKKSEGITITKVSNGFLIRPDLNRNESAEYTEMSVFNNLGPTEEDPSGENLFGFLIKHFEEDN